MAKKGNYFDTQDVMNACFDNVNNLLKVSIISGGAGGEQYADGTAVSAAYKGNIILGTDGSNYQIISVDSSGVVDVLDTNSAAILADTTTIASDTTSIDGKITACNTGAVVVSSGAITETNSGTIAGDTTSIDGKITACNTGAIVGTVTTALEGKILLKKTVDFTASQTAQDIWTPAGGNKFVLVSYIITCTTAGIITLFDETNDTTNRVGKHDLSANTSGNCLFPLPLPSSTADNDLKYTTGTAVGSITCFGYEI